MMPGPKPKPSLAVVREGNPSKRPVRDSMVLPPEPLVEPKWGRGPDGLGLDAETTRDAKEVWNRVAVSLERAAGLTQQQRDTLVEYCICVARIRQGERMVSREGTIITNPETGVMSRHPMMMNLNQYRGQFRTLIGELGLSPASATRINRPGAGSGGEDPFD